MKPKFGAWAHICGSDLIRDADGDGVANFLDPAVPVDMDGDGDDAEDARRAMRSAQPAAALSHANIIPIYAVRDTDLLVFFVMKFVEGRPLDYRTDVFAVGWPDAPGEVGSLERVLRSALREQRRAEVDNTLLLDKLRSVMGTAPLGLAFTRSRLFELVSDEWCRLLGYPESMWREVKSWSERLMRIDMRERDGHTFTEFIDANMEFVQALMPIAQERARRGAKLRMLTEGVFVIGAIAAVVGWLNQWFHFWS